MPPYNDENMIMLRAAMRVVPPRLNRALCRLTSRAFHLALARDRGAATRAAAQSAKTSGALADAFSAATFQRAQTFQTRRRAGSGPCNSTDYEGVAAQAVQIRGGHPPRVADGGRRGRCGGAGAVRPAIESAYAQARDPNTFHPAAFRLTFERIADVIQLQ